MNNLLSKSIFLSSLIFIMLMFQNCGPGFEARRFDKKLSDSNEQGQSSSTINSPTIETSAAVEPVQTEIIDSIIAEENLPGPDVAAIIVSETGGETILGEEVSEPQSSTETEVASLQGTQLNEVPSYAKYKGVTKEMWNKIENIGDPLSCKTKVDRLNNSENGIVLSPCNGDCINQALQNNNIVTLRGGEYRVSQTIRVSANKILKGQDGERVVIIASGLDVGMEIVEATSSNLEIQYAENHGVVLQRNTLAHRIIVGNTGVNIRSNPVGSGFSMLGENSRNHCLVSVEAYNGYNEDGLGCVGCANGGNADGIAIKARAHNVTLIDAHAYQNSDDGFDFWEGGAITSFANLRVFYSSSNRNGLHPTRASQDGNGFKFGSNKVDRGTRFVYGSSSCNNKSNGFDQNGSIAKIEIYNSTATGNRKNFARVTNEVLEQDQNVMKCD